MKTQNHDYPVCALFRGGLKCTCVFQDPPDEKPKKPPIPFCVPTKKCPICNGRDLNCIECDGTGKVEL